MSTFNFKKYAMDTGLKIASTTPQMSEESDDDWADLDIEESKPQKTSEDMNRGELLLFCMDNFQMLSDNKMTEIYYKLIEICNGSREAAESVVNADDNQTEMVQHMLHLVKQMDIAQLKAFAALMKK